MATGDLVARAVALFRAEDWSAAAVAFAVADEHLSLDPDHLEMLATARYMVGDHAGFVSAMDRAHRIHVPDDPRRAARCAFWIGMTLFMQGETGPGTGWLGRASRMLQEEPDDCPERGWLLLPAIVRASAEGEHATALEMARQAHDFGVRHDDRDLTSLALCEQGRALVRLGRAPDGVPLLDEVMVSVTTGETSPIVTGILYCSVIEGCNEAFAVGRAKEWTDALSGWCDSHPDMLPFSGQCLVHRSEVLELQGAWDDALDEAERSRRRFALSSDDPAEALAHYRLGELSRLRGMFVEAAEAYRRAGEIGGRTQPGLALLRHVEGNSTAALAAIRRTLAESATPALRTRLLPAHVEIALGAGEVAEAAEAAAELSRTATTTGSPHLDALAASARGAVALAEGRAAAALVDLRAAAEQWRRTDMPFELARTRVRIADACRSLGDDEAAAVELSAARATFESLGAAPSLATLDHTGSVSSNPLTDREMEVLRLVAEGRTNRAIADELYLSVKTIDRHMSNILTKLGVPSRAAAIAVGYERGIL